MSSKQRHTLTAIIRDRKGVVLSVGQNSYTKTHPLMADLAKKANMPDRIYLHAEVHAIVRCQDISKAHSIEIFRFNKEGKPVNAAPCKICQSAIQATPIKRVRHT